LAAGRPSRILEVQVTDEHVRWQAREGQRPPGAFDIRYGPPREWNEEIALEGIADFDAVRAGVDRLMEVFCDDERWARGLPTILPDDSA
jgi:hypothetical protein